MAEAKGILRCGPEGLASLCGNKGTAGTASRPGIPERCCPDGQTTRLLGWW